MKFIENNTYTLQTDYYNSVKVVCTWVTYNTAYFKLSTDDHSLGSDYRVDIQSKKLHKWNSKYHSWDLIENTLSEDTVEDVWSKRMGNQSYSYDGMNQGD